MNVEKARVHYLSQKDKPIVRNKDVLCFNYNNCDFYILEEDKNESPYLLYKDEHGEYWMFYNCAVTYERFDKVINNSVDEYQKEDYIEYCNYITENVRLAFDNIRKYVLDKINNNSFFNLVELSYLADNHPDLYEDALNSREIYRTNQKAYEEKQHKEYMEELTKKVNDKNQLFNEEIEKMKKDIINGKEILSKTLEYYKQDEYYSLTYQNNFLYLFKEYGITVPLKTQGYINNKLYSFDFGDNNYRFYGKYVSPYLGKYFIELKDKIFAEKEKSSISKEDDLDITDSMY